MDPHHSELYKETILYDLYLRENMKKRPEWAPDLSGYRSQINKFMREKGYQNKYCHLEPFYYPVHEINVRQNPAYGLSVKRADAPQWVLFDYEKRDTWTKEAGIVWMNDM